MKTLVIQSFREVRPRWIDRCLASVRTWAQTHGFDYRFHGDELFDNVPHWYLEKTVGKRPVAADHARLILIREALAEGYDRALWIDADVLVMDCTLSVDIESSCAFGWEIWIQRDGDSDSGLRSISNVHNAICVFQSGCPVLPFLIHVTESIIRRADPRYIAPQMVGPKLLTALHGIAGFTLLPEVGALSPAVIADINAGGGKALTLLRAKSEVPLKAVNLCASLVDDAAAETALGHLENNCL